MIRTRPHANALASTGMDGTPPLEPHRPGRFSLRELPPSPAVLATTERLDLPVINGYVDLDPAGTPGRVDRPVDGRRR